MSATAVAERAAQQNDLLPRLYRSMLQTRMVEEAVAQRYAAQEMRCPVHLSIGQEGISSGVCVALRGDDQITSTHRAHSHYMAKGGHVGRMLAEFHGKADGCCGGRGGSMHLFDDDVGVLLSLPIVGSSIPVAVGAAFGIRQAGGDQVVVSFFGDAAVEEGAFHEAANFAALKKLPVIFVCENNLYSVYTRLDDRQPRRPLTALAAAHDIPAFHADGNDAVAVYDLTTTAVERARRGEGPTFLLFDTYRWLEHCGPNYDNDLGYRTVAEFEEWRERDPVEQLRRRMAAAEQWNQKYEDEVRAELTREIDEAFDFALASPLPDPQTAGIKIYA